MYGRSHHVIFEARLLAHGYIWPWSFHIRRWTPPRLPGWRGHVWALRGQRLLRGLSLERKGWDVGKVSKWKVLLRPVREDAGITENG